MLPLFDIISFKAVHILGHFIIPVWLLLWMLDLRSLHVSLIHALVNRGKNRKSGAISVFCF